MSWTPIELAFPPYGETVEWQRRNMGDDKPFVAAWREFHPEMNVAGLWWRPLRDRLAELGIG